MIKTGKGHLLLKPEKEEKKWHINTEYLVGKTVLSSTPAASELSGSGQGNDGAEMLNIFLTWVSANYGILILIIIAIIGMSL